MVGHRHPFGNFEIGKAVVDFGKGVADQGEKDPAGGFATTDGDEDFLSSGSALMRAML
jgi:hypothetical protein